MISDFNFFSPFFFSRIREKAFTKEFRVEKKIPLKVVGRRSNFLFAKYLLFQIFENRNISSNLKMEFSKVLAIICQYGRP